VVTREMARAGFETHALPGNVPAAAPAAGPALPPANMRSQVFELPGSVRIVIPNRRLALLPWLIALPFAVIGGSVIAISAAAFRSALPANAPGADVWPLIAYGVAATPLLVVGVKILGVMRGQTLVTASPSGLRIETRRAFTSSAVDVPAGELIGVECNASIAPLDRMQITNAATNPAAAAANAQTAERVVSVLEQLIPSRGIFVKSRRGLQMVGAGLTTPELLYLHSVLTRAIGA
jgi:hypothetical protein